MSDGGAALGGQVAVVTGASSGLGREIAIALGTAGARVAVMARSADQLEETAALVEKEGGCAVAEVVDVADRSAVERAFGRVEERLGPVDLLVNNAGVAGPLGPFWELDEDEWWAAMEVNLRGAVRCLAAVLPGMVARRSGRVVNVGSNAGIHRWPNLSAYSVSKSALIKLTENLAIEAKKHRVRLFAIDPGMLRVGMTAALLDAEIPPGHPAAVTAEWFRQQLAAGREVPLARGAELVVALAEGRADALSGCYLTVYDDLERLVGQAATIRRRDLRTLRLGEPIV